MTEREIILGCKKKDKRSQKAFVLTYSNYLYSICRRYVREDSFAQDCLQESLVRILTKIDLYKIDRSFKAWIAKVTSNQCLQFLRSNNKIHFLSIEEAFDASYDESTTGKLEWEEIMEYLFQLPDKYRLAINLYIVEGFSHKEIAEMLGITEGSSRSLVSRARKMVTDKFKEDHNNIKMKQALNKNPLSNIR